jgi:hypothetical protein
MKSITYKYPDNILRQRRNKSFRSMTHLPHNMCSGSIRAQNHNSLSVGFHSKSRLGCNKTCRHTSQLPEGNILAVFKINKDVDDKITLKITSQILDTGKGRSTLNTVNRWNVVLTLALPGQQYPSPHYSLIKLINRFIR